MLLIALPLIIVGVGQVQRVIGMVGYDAHRLVQISHVVLVALIVAF